MGESSLCFSKVFCECKIYMNIWYTFSIYMASAFLYDMPVSNYICYITGKYTHTCTHTQTHYGSWYVCFGLWRIDRILRQKWGNSMWICTEVRSPTVCLWNRKIITWLAQVWALPREGAKAQLERVRSVLVECPNIWACAELSRQKEPWKDFEQRRGRIRDG